MIDREKVLCLLRHRFPEATAEQLAAAANGLAGLDDEWVELTDLDAEIEAHLSRPCGQSCSLVESSAARFRLFSRRSGE